MKPRIIHKLVTIKKLVSNKLIDNGIYPDKRSPKLIIIMYHGIDKSENTTYNSRFFSVANFEKHIISLKKHFNILTYKDFLEDNYSTKKTNIVITFDDGYANNFNYALPVLEKYNAHAFFFVTGVGTMEKKILWADALDIVSHYAPANSKITLNGVVFSFAGTKFVCDDTNTDLVAYIQASNKPGYTEKENLIEQLLNIYDFTKHKETGDYWELMNDEQIYKASLSNNITIGSHGFYHNNLGSLNNADAVNEVRLSKKYLEGIMQKEVGTIAFPDGSYTEQLNESLEKEGFKKQFLVNYRFGDENKKKNIYDRFGLYPGMGNNHRIIYKIMNQ